VNRGGRLAREMKRREKSKPLGWGKSTAPWVQAQRADQRLIESILPEEKTKLAELGRMGARLVPPKIFLEVSNHPGLIAKPPGVVVSKASRGRHTHPDTVRNVKRARQMMRRGMKQSAIAEKLDMKLETLKKQLRRHPEVQ
jgi:hypothetical protein